MEPIKLNTREAIIFLTLVGMGVGLVLGLVPLIYGRIKGKTKLGVIGLATSILAGAIWSILPLLVMIIFVFLIIRDSKPKPAEVIVVNDNPIDVSVGDSDNQ